MAMPTVIPERFRVVSRPETPNGWTACEHRGATIRCCGVHNVLLMPDHSYHGASFGQASFVETLIDLWLDERRLPQGYRAGTSRLAPD
ncbi:hypothetical protein [Teichococcus aestuarii]|uniref:hypothetical protein n=1 Tax=Teichococcus aestuarii TaxID=568898 RepID=UPI0036109451